MFYSGHVSSKDQTTVKNMCSSARHSCFQSRQSNIFITLYKLNSQNPIKTQYIEMKNSPMVGVGGGGVGGQREVN